MTTTADTVHAGADDLHRWPPSMVELELARRVIRHPGNQIAVAELIEVAQSPWRAALIVVAAIPGYTYPGQYAECDLITECEAN